MLIAMQWAWAETVPFGKGQLTVKYVARNAVRIQYDEGGVLPEQLPDWSYVKTDEVADHGGIHCHTPRHAGRTGYADLQIAEG